MEEFKLITWALIIANGIVTYKGLTEYAFFNKFMFNVSQIEYKKDYKRLVTSGFLHADWTHFAFNMFTLYIFSQSLEAYVEATTYFILFFASLIGGNLFALYIHKNHPNYSAIGASGAVSGIVFAAIGLIPGMKVGFILLPFYFPAWLYGIAFVVYSIYGINSQRDNIGHEAHLGGGIIGLLIAIIINPNIMTTNFLPIILILIPTLTFLFLKFKK